MVRQDAFGHEVRYADGTGTELPPQQQEPARPDTIFDVASLTKLFTSIAVLQQVESGAVRLDAPVAQYLPEFGGQGKAGITVQQLLTHTSGLTYAFNYLHPVDELYRRAGFEYGMADNLDLQGCCDAWADMPLLFDPGRAWNYSVATDVLGRIVEVVSGQTLDEFFRTRIFEPLGMTDTGFAVPPEKLDRLAALYTADEHGKAAVPRSSAVPKTPPKALSGGGGLISSAHDYHRFTSMLLGRGQLDGV